MVTYSFKLYLPKEKLIIEGINNLRMYKRVTFKLIEYKSQYAVEVKSNDIPALRAAFNSITRDMEVLINAKRVIGK